MSIPGLHIIGESINDSVPSTHKLFEAEDIEGLKALAQFQDEAGATYIDVNVGSRDAVFMAQMVSEVQQVTRKPLSVDTPDVELARAGLGAIEGDQVPLLNSISPLRTEMFDLLEIRPFMPILLVSERADGGESSANHTAEQTYDTACALRALAAERGLENEEIIIDPGIAPIASDSEGNLKRLMAALGMMHADENFNGCHYSVGLSNFTVGLPPKRANGEPVKSPLESAFLTRAMALGLDMVIGSVKRKYRTLEEGDEALVCFDEALEASGFDAIMRVQEFYG